MTAAAEPVGKAALAHELGWSRPKLDRRLSEDAAFPVVSRGDQSGGWKFDVAAVKSHLGVAAPVAPAKSKPKSASVIDRAQLRDSVAPLPPAPARPTAPPRRSAHHQGEATARQRKDAADAALRENKLKVENGELVDRGELRQKLAGMLGSLGSDMDAIPEAVIKVLIEATDKGLALQEATPLIRELIDKVRIQMVTNASAVLSDD